MNLGNYQNLIEVALNARLVGEQSDEERESNRRAAAQARLDARNDWTATRNRYADVPALLAVLELHQPKDDNHGWPECSYAESDEYATEWPCSTYTAIKEA